MTFGFFWQPMLLLIISIYIHVPVINIFLINYHNTDSKKIEIYSWEKMKYWVRETFPLYHSQMIFSQFNNLWQESQSNLDYTKEFYKLMARNDV